MSLAFWRRGKDVKSYLRRTKTVRFRGMVFEIRRVGLDDHLAGLNVVLQIRGEYQRERPTDPTKVLEDQQKFRKFARDFIYAGVVSPKLTLKDGDGDALHVDEITSDNALANRLVDEIIVHSYGKKN